MHWTLQLLIGLSLLCLAGNAVQAVMVRSVRSSGLLVCLAWAVQEAYWFITGGDSFALFLICDAILVWWFVRHSSGEAERIAGALILPTTCLAVFQKLYGHTETTWWVNYWIVAAQMALCLPRPKFQRSLHSYSHGRLRPNLEA